MFCITRRSGLSGIQGSESAAPAYKRSDCLAPAATNMHMPRNAHRYQPQHQDRALHRPQPARRQLNSIVTVGDAAAVHKPPVHCQGTVPCGSQVQRASLQMSAVVLPHTMFAVVHCNALQDCKMYSWLPWLKCKLHWQHPYVGVYIEVCL